MTERRASESTDTADHRDDLDYRALARQSRFARPAPGPHRHHRARRRGQLPQLGNVFVANMTGNVVFLGFGLTQKTSISALASLVAIATFLLGALGGGRVARHHGGHRGRHQAIAATIGLAGFLLSRC